MDSSLPTILLLLPVVGAAVVCLGRPGRFCRWAALVSTLSTLVWSLVLVIAFDAKRGDHYGYAADGGSLQLVTDARWIPQLHVHFKLAVDGLSLPLVVMSCFILTLAVAASWRVEKMQRAYFSLLLLLQSAVLGAFVSVDLFLFYVFFELSLLPMYFLIGLWGGPKREAAAIKFFLYTLVGSVALLGAVIGIYQVSKSVVPGGTFDMIVLTAHRAAFAGPVGLGLFSLAMLGFLVKLPAVPFHTWLPEAHVEAPTPISMVLAAVLLKLGGYGILRVAYPLFPDAAAALWPVVAIIGVVSLLYGALCAMAQTDFKRLVAYSSVSHMGLVTVGAAMMTPAGFDGAVFMMIGHGVTSAMLFFVVGVVYDRAGHRDLTRLGGMAQRMPAFTGLGVVASFANLGLPGLCGFVGEAMVLFGVFQAAGPKSVLSHHAGGSPRFVTLVCAIGVAACFNLVLTAGYTLRAVQRIFLGPVRAEFSELSDVDRREAWVLTPLAVAAIALGVLPTTFVFGLTDSSSAAILKLFGA